MQAGEGLAAVVAGLDEVDLGGDHAGDVHHHGGQAQAVGHQAGLVASVAQAVNALLAAGFQNAQAGVVAGLEDHIHAVFHHGDGGLLAQGGVVKGAGDDGLDLDVGRNAGNAVDESVLIGLLGGVVAAAHIADLAALGHQRGHNDADVSALALTVVREHDVGGQLVLGHILGGVAGDEEVHVGIVLRHAAASVAVLGAVADHEVIALLAVAAEHGLHVVGAHVFGIGGLVAHFPDLLKALIGGLVPGLIGNGTGQQDGDLGNGAAVGDSLPGGVGTVVPAGSSGIVGAAAGGQQAQGHGQSQGQGQNSFHVVPPNQYGKLPFNGFLYQRERQVPGARGYCGRRWPGPGW